MESNRAKANQELPFPGRLSFRSLLLNAMPSVIDMMCYPCRWRGLAGRRKVASNGGK